MIFQQGGVKLDGETVSDIEETVLIDGERVLQVGKRGFVRLVEPKE